MHQPIARVRGATRYSSQNKLARGIGQREQNRRLVEQMNGEKEAEWILREYQIARHSSRETRGAEPDAQHEEQRGDGADDAQRLHDEGGQSEPACQPSSGRVSRRNQMSSGKSSGIVRSKSSAPTVARDQPSCFNRASYELQL